MLTEGQVKCACGAVENETGGVGCRVAVCEHDDCILDLDVEGVDGRHRALDVEVAIDDNVTLDIHVLLNDDAVCDACH